ncbi:granulocyte-macrophage colony-stimulating factor receptor subunit alpha [Amia ocellicauda]|uniref:granulocyte-macrophage colony-stimulating factor receptor subunit alpha n=1 Tax=Amia ocellicauda TaxID=2972642 RepID=UPI00346426D2
MEPSIVIGIICIVLAGYVKSEKDSPQWGNDCSGTSHIECILYNVSTLNCTWCPLSLETNETLIFRQNEQEQQCPVNIKDKLSGRNVCHFPHITIDRDFTFTVSISVSNKSSLTTFDPLLIEKLNPPSDFKLLLEKNLLMLSWKPPLTKDPIAGYCFQYQLCIENLDSQWKIIVNRTVNTYNSSIDVSKRYALTARVKGQPYCGFGDIWSRWTKKICVGSVMTNNSEVLLHSLLILPFLVTLILLICCKRYKVIDKILPAVPHPQEKVVDWFLTFDKVYEEKVESYKKCQNLLDDPVILTQPVEDISNDVAVLGINDYGKDYQTTEAHFPVII